MRASPGAGFEGSGASKGLNDLGAANWRAFMTCGRVVFFPLGNLYGIEQKMSHQGGSVRTRVDAVSGPMIWGCVFDRLVEHGLKGNE